ncbi:Heterokaryon incompatibility protein (HET) domain containing protein [Rhypophila decipiens]
MIKGTRATADSAESHAHQGGSDELCLKCRRYGLDEAEFHCDLSEEERLKHRVSIFNWEDEEDERLIATDLIRNLSHAPDCRLCQLVLSAVQEQHDFVGKTVDENGRYRLEWLYVPRKFSRYQDTDGQHVRMVQVFSPANSDPDRLAKGVFRFADITKRENIRSLIAPMQVDGEGDLSMKARKVDAQIDVGLLRRQLDGCEAWHGDHCKELTGELKNMVPSPDFMLIDVVDMCLVSPGEPPRYVALSYVWGANGENSFLTTVSSVSDLQQAMALKSRWGELPDTIQDAITVVQGLGERYLWVDSLCIIQDDAENKQANIESMADVYAGATFAIVAASRQHAKAGLPGVRPESRGRPQRCATVGGSRELVLLDDIELLLGNAPWMTRGWTYQEWFYSSRCLIFLEGQVVFSCRCATWREDVIFEQGEPNKITNLNNVDFSYMCLGYELRPFRRFYLQRDIARDIGDILMNTIHEYRTRKLTYDGDILNAFQGVLADFARLLDSKELMGAVLGVLDWCILVQVQGVRRTQFPSWSWVGWADFPQWIQEDDLLKWINEKCWIVWHHRGITGDTIERVERDQTIEWNPDPKLLECSEAEDWNGIPFAARVQWQTYKHGRTTEATRFDLPPDLPCDPSIPVKRALLQFWTYATKLRLSKAREGWAEVALHDCDGIECGSVVLCSGATSGSKPMEECDILIHSEANWAMGGSLYVKHRDRKTVRDPERHIVEGSLNILLVAWNGPVAEKLGVGKIFEETVHFLGDHALEWKEVVLA